MGFKESAIKGVRWTSFSTIILAITQLITIAVLARFLAKSDFGLMAIVMVVKGFADLFMDLGITVAILHKQNITTNEYSSLYWMNMAIGFVIYFILCLITPFIASFYQEMELLKLIPLMCLAIPISSIGRQQKTMLQKELYFKDIAIVDIISSVLSLCIAIYFAMTDWGIYALVFSNLMRYTLSNIIYFFIGIKKVPVECHFQFKETMPFFKIGMYNTGGQVINYFSTSFDVLIIGKLLGSDSLGIYNLAKELVIKPSSVVAPIITRVVTPLFSKMQNEKKTLLTYFFSMQKIIANINAYIYLGIFILAHPIVNLYYGKGYDTCVPIVGILALYYMLREYGQPMSMVCIAKGRTDIDMWWNVLMLFIFPAFVTIGALESIKAVSISLLLLNIVMFYPGWYIYARRLLGINFFSYYGSLISTFKLFLLPTLVTLIFVHNVDFSSIWLFISGGLIFSLFVFILFYFFNRNSFQMILKLVSK
ncbi:MAG: MOP flippase family protein [Bacteroidales bacterium]